MPNGSRLTNPSSGHPMCVKAESASLSLGPQLSSVSTVDTTDSNGHLPILLFMHLDQSARQPGSQPLALGHALSLYSLQRSLLLWHNSDLAA